MTTLSPKHNTSLNRNWATLSNKSKTVIHSTLTLAGSIQPLNKVDMLAQSKFCKPSHNGISKWWNNKRLKGFYRACEFDLTGSSYKTLNECGNKFSGQYPWTGAQFSCVQIIELCNQIVNDLYEQRTSDIHLDSKTCLAAALYDTEKSECSDSSVRQSATRGESSISFTHVCSSFSTNSVNSL